MARLSSGFEVVYCALLCCLVCSLLIPDLGYNFYIQADGDNISFLVHYFCVKNVLFFMFAENSQ